MYQQSGAAGQPGGDQFNGGQQQAQQEGPKAEDIQDADFEEVK
jgi:molecular chaperone DnaK